MARGWESKSVEAQQDAAAESRPPGPPVDRGDAERRTARATLVLARARAAADLEQARAPAHRTMLEQAMAELDDRLRTLDDPKPH